MKTLLVIGATGIMGRRVIRLATRLLPEVPIIGASRNPPRDLVDFYWRPIDLDDPASLEAMISQANVVINAAGTYAYDPTPIVSACCKHHCHYIDLAETSDLARQKIKPALDAYSAKHPEMSIPTFVSGASTIPGMIEVFAQRWKEREDVAAINSYLSIGTANPVSPSLIHSMLRPIGRHDPHSQPYFSKLVARDQDGKSKRYGNYPAAFESTGIHVGDTTLEARFFFGFDRNLYARAIHLLAPLISRLSNSTLARFARIASWLAPAIRCFGHSHGNLALDALNNRGVVVDSLRVDAYAEGLDVPSLPSVLAARALLRNEGDASGLIGLADLISPEQMTTCLRQESFCVSKLTT